MFPICAGGMSAAAAAAPKSWSTLLVALNRWSFGVHSAVLRCPSNEFHLDHPVPHILE